MPRKYYRKRYVNKDKYSHETTNIQTPLVTNWTLVPSSSDTTASSRQFKINIVPPVDTQGMRKVKHIVASFSVQNVDYNPVMYYYIVYVPQGYDSQNVVIPSAGNSVNGYSANQFIMGSGVLDFSGGPCRIRSALSRNLNSGDSIVMVIAAPADWETNLYAQVSYAITLQ